MIFLNSTGDSDVGVSFEQVKKIAMMEKPISPATHCLIDYALVASLLSLPTALGLPKEVRRLYAAEALVLTGYVAVTAHPAALKPLIPIRTHGKIDPFNVAAFALQTFATAFRRNKKAAAFNLAFTAVTGLLVLMTDWKKGHTKSTNLNKVSPLF